MAVEKYRFVMRQGTAAVASAANDTLYDGEWGYETDTGKLKIGDGTTHWNDLPYFAPSSPNYDWIIALGDETTALTTGTAKVTIRAPRAMTLSKIKASLTTASSSGAPAFDVKKNGTSLFSTALTIDATEKTSETAATAAVLATTTIAADDELTFDITAAGTAAAGAKITLVAAS